MQGIRKNLQSIQWYLWIYRYCWNYTQVITRCFRFLFVLCDRFCISHFCSFSFYLSTTRGALSRFRISVCQWYVLCYSFSCGWFAIGLCTSSDTFSSTTTPWIRTIITCFISRWLILLILFKRNAIGTNNGLFIGSIVVNDDIYDSYLWLISHGNETKTVNHAFVSLSRVAITFLVSSEWNLFWNSSSSFFGLSFSIFLVLRIFTFLLSGVPNLDWSEPQEWKLPFWKRDDKRW